MLACSMAVAGIAVGLVMGIGPTEAAQLDLRWFYSEVKTVPANKSVNITKGCPQGYQVSGGGFNVWENNLFIVKNQPSKSADQWEVEAFSPKIPGKISAAVVCARIGP